MAEVGRRGLLEGHARGPLLVLASVSLVDQVDLSLLRGVLPLLEEEFGLSDLQLGLLGFAFVFVNAIATIPAGWAADRYRRTRIIGWTLLSWSALSAVAATSVNYIHLFLARASLGFGQALDDPASTALLADYYPPRLRGRVFSVQQVSIFLGAGLGLGLGGLVGSTLGWRWSFVLIGMPGSLVALAVFRLREPRRGEADPGEATSTTEAAPTRAETTLGWRSFVAEAWRSLRTELTAILRIRTLRTILVGVGTLLFTASGVAFWAAVYHDRYSGLTLAQATGLTAAMLAVGGTSGTLAGGRIADRVYGQGMTGRIEMVSTAIVVGGVLFPVSLAVPWIALRFLIQTLAVMALSSAAPALRAAMMDVVPASSRGVSVSAFALTSTVFGTAAAPPIVGWLSDVTGSLLVAFYIVSPPIVIGGLLVRRAKHTITEDAQAIIGTFVAPPPDQATGGHDADREPEEP